MNILVSIIIPTYNRAHLIGITLDSILAQSYTFWECLVIDDSSTDSTEALLQSYIDKDDRFRYYKRPDNKPKGANACRNYGFELSKGDFINWFDSDDIMAPNKLEDQLKLLSQHQEAPYCICQTNWVDKKQNIFLGLRSTSVTSNKRLEDYILYNIFWTTIAPLWRRTFLNNNKLLFDETLHQSQEYDFHIRVLSINHDYVHTDKPLVTLIKHGDNLSNNIYKSDVKIASNLKVKDKIINHHIHQLSSKGALRFLEIQTLMFKDLLVKHKFKFARQIISQLFKIMKFVDVSFLRKMVFCGKIIMAYTSYSLLGRGYTIVKPLSS